MPVDLTRIDDQAYFAHLLWIGGAADAGKTTVSRLLAERHRWQWYPCDVHEHNHLIARADPGTPSGDLRGVPEIGRGALDTADHRGTLPRRAGDERRALSNDPG